MTTTDLQNWPTAPIAVSQTEAVIESFWDGARQAAQRWSLSDGEARVESGWDATLVHWPAPRPGRVVQIQRAYDLNIVIYERMVFRVQTGFGVRTSLFARVDGEERVIFEDLPGSHSVRELAGPIRGARLTGVRICFTLDQPEATHAQLRWLMLDRPGIAWDPPAEPFEGMIVEQAVERFEPGLGLLHDAADTERLRRLYRDDPVYAKVRADDLAFAREQAGVDPETLVRRYALYIGGRGRYDRESDAVHDFRHDGIVMAMVGLIERDDILMRLAAKHAIVLARLEAWTEGFVEGFPGSGRDGRGWRHAAFAPNVATITASLLLDLTWYWLTPQGRTLVRDAIRIKGIPHIEPLVDPACYAMRMNQGARFLKGVVLGQMAIAPRLDDSGLRQTIGTYHERMNDSLAAQTRDDGTLNEGTGYGAHTLESTMVTYHAVARCLGQPVSRVVPERVLRCLRFILEAERKTAPGLAAFAAGPLGDAAFDSHCVPQGFVAGWSIEMHYLGLDALWSPAKRAVPGEAALPQFSVYPRGGWVFIGSEDTKLPRVTLESGLWAEEGHAWKTKNALTLDAFGQTLLLTRQYANYNDSRFDTTARTAAYNTFSPGGRSQNESPRGNRGAVLRVARDLGLIAAVESDAASAWSQGVRVARRRVVLLRPLVVLVEDTAELDHEEAGVQSWNTLGHWTRMAEHHYELRAGGICANVHCILPLGSQLADAEDSVHEGKTPVFRMAITSPAAKSHRVATLIAVVPPDTTLPAPRVRLPRADGSPIEVEQGDTVARIALAPLLAGTAEGWGCESDGDLTIALSHRGRLAGAWAFGATFLHTPTGTPPGERL